MIHAKGCCLVATVKVKVANQIGNENGKGDHTGANAVDDKCTVLERIVVHDDEDVPVAGSTRVSCMWQTHTCQLKDATETGGAS